ncbi:MAG: SIR2 family protein [Lachnospiraceae bacterium]|nr:SIR2 family protein [Lachnospiraceae bacterium]
MEKLNVIHYMNELRNILSYAANIGFFFGAGTSCAFGLPSIEQLTNEVKDSLLASQKDLFVTVENLLRDLSKKTTITIEDVLNHLREVRSLTQDRPDYEFKGLTGAQAKELDHSICNAVFEIIKARTESANVSDLRRFFAWYDAANRGFVKEIYTTNYDMLLEMAMEANRTPYFDGFTGSYEPFFSPETIEVFPGEKDVTSKWIRLWKIHGSLNWMKKLGDELSEEHIIRVGKIDKPQNELMIYPSRAKYSLSRKEPYIAYFDRLKKYLSYGECVFIVSGYSFGDEHINEVIFNALRNNSRLYVVVLCYGDEQVEAMEKYASAYINLCVAGPTKVIVNSMKKEWIYNEAEEQDIGAGMYWDKTRSKFLLGDFKSLIDFFIENSGRKNVIEEMTNAK